MTLAARSPGSVDETLPVATLERFRAGDPEAFAEVIRKFQPLLRAAVGRYFRGAFAREDAMQEIWIHLFKSREALDPARFEYVSGWLAVLARRRCIDLLRRSSDPAEPASESEDVALQWLRSPPEQEDDAMNLELARAVAAFKEKLKPTWRGFFQLHFVDGQDYAEAGKLLGIGKLRCKYMRRVIAARARRSPALIAALGRALPTGRPDAS